MFESVAPPIRVVARPRAPRRPTTLAVLECEHDTPRVAMPRPELQIVVRIGAPARGGLDAHAFGVRDKVHRKTLQRGQRIVSARLPLGASEALFGVPAPALTGRLVPLEELWGEAPTARLFDRLASAPDALRAASLLEAAIAERLARATRIGAGAQLALDAAPRLRSASVYAVADDLGVSERHLRRVFRETIGVSPKAYAKLTRFHHALAVADADARASWATIAAEAGYYDQAHLIAEFRAIAGVTPRALLAELRAAPALR